MKMSTYLVALIVGRLEATDPVDVDGIPLRIVHVPGKGHLCSLRPGCRRSCVALVSAVLRHCLPRQEGRHDCAARFRCRRNGEPGLHHVPRELTAGGYHDIDPKSRNKLPTSSVTNLPICGSATWSQCAGGTASGSTKRLRHLWKSWRWRCSGPSGSAGPASARNGPKHSRWTRWQSTRTVEFAVQAPSDCDGMFDVLTYQKGGALLRMLQQYFGEERFRRGVNNYLNRTPTATPKQVTCGMASRR